MSSSSAVSRRAMLKAVAGAVVAYAAGAGGHAPPVERVVAARLRALVPHAAGAAVLGATYLQQARHEASTRRLVAAVLPARRLATAARASDRQLGRMVANRIRGDFAAGRTVMLRGWVVSLTEARLAALALTD